MAVATRPLLWQWCTHDQVPLPGWIQADGGVEGMPFVACCTLMHHLATPSAPEVICAGPPAQPPPIAPDFSPTEPYACRRSMAQLHWCMGRGLVTCRGRAARPIQAPWAQLPPRDRSTTSSWRSSRCALPARARAVSSCTRRLPAPTVLKPLTVASCACAGVDVLEADCMRWTVHF